MNDPSKPPHSHPDFGGSTTNNPPEPPSHGGAGGDSTTKRKTTTSHNNKQEGTLSTPTIRHQTKSSSSTGKVTAAATTTTTVTTSGVPRHWNKQNIPNNPEPWRKEEIHLLKDILDFCLNNGRYPYSNIDDLQDFFKNWVQERGFYRDYIDLNRKMESLNLRFLTNMEKKSNGEDVEESMDSTEKEIFQLSIRVWGTENEEEEEDDDDDDDDLKDEREMGDDGDVIDTKDSCKDSKKESGISDY